MGSRKRKRKPEERWGPPHARLDDQAVESRCYEIFSRWNGGPEDAVSAWLEAEREVYRERQGAGTLSPGGGVPERG